MNNEYITIKKFQKDVTVKVNQYIHTNKAKSMVSWPRWQENKPITKEHLMAVILYTDFTELSSAFTASFRRKNPFETEEQVKKRNHRNYWFWSKYLYQVLNYYGANNYDDADEAMKGPFYCRMSSIMTLPQFNIYLYAPTSTSVHIEVSMVFSGDHGMILEFANSVGFAQGTKGFDCSWLSRYKEEDERYADLYGYSCALI